MVFGIESLSQAVTRIGRNFGKRGIAAFLLSFPIFIYKGDSELIWVLSLLIVADTFLGLARHYRDCSVCSCCFSKVLSKFICYLAIVGLGRLISLSIGDYFSVNVETYLAIVEIQSIYRNWSMLKTKTCLHKAPILRLIPRD